VSTGGPQVEQALSVATAAVLRRLFDASFAAPAVSKAERLEDLLAIRVGSDAYAFRLAEISGLHVDLKVVPVPSPVAPLLGIVGVRGVMAPIYDLAAILCYPSAVSRRWVVFARAPQLVGLAFESFESHLKVSEASLAGSENEERTGISGQHMRGTVRAAGVLRPIIHMASVVATLKGLNP
jgi:chemotaxis signal transduction protein